MENWIVQLWMFQTLIFEGHVDYTCPQEVIVVEIDKDLLTPLNWVEYCPTIKDCSLTGSVNYLGTCQLSFFGPNTKESNVIHYQL